MKDSVTPRLLTLAASYLHRAADDLEAAKSPQLAAECDNLRCRVLAILEVEVEGGQDTLAVYDTLEAAVVYVTGYNDAMRFVAQWRVPRNITDMASNQHAYVTEEEVDDES